MLLWALLPSATRGDGSWTSLGEVVVQGLEGRAGRRQTGVPLAVRPGRLEQGGSDQKGLLTVIVQMHSLLGG